MTISPFLPSFAVNNIKFNNNNKIHPIGDIRIDEMEVQQKRRRMGSGKTRYSRTTWSKNQLRASIANSPNYGSKACNLCEGARIPDDLFFKVSKYKTCGDVHLELSLLSPSQATCQAGQDAYRDMCCKTSFLGKMTKPKPVLSVTIGLILFWLFAKRARRISSASQRGNGGDDEAGDIEVRGSSSYQRMDEDDSAAKKKSRSRSKSRDRANTRARSKSRDRTATKRSRSKDPSKATKNSKANEVVHTFKKGSRNKSIQPADMEIQIEPLYHIHDEEHLQEGHWQEQSGTDDASANAYYHLDEDPSFADNSTMAGNTMAGDTIDAVVTQVV
jgi:hypothetical protein